MSNFFDHWRGQQPAWLDGSGPAAEIVIGTQARVSRNIAGFQFPIQAKPAELATIRQELDTALCRPGRLGNAHVLHLADITEQQRALLREKHLITPLVSRNPDNRGLVVAPEGQLAGLINEDDHLRISAFCSGFDPIQVATAAAGLEADLEKEVPFAYREDLGYLTSWPGSVGTGLRLSALLHLPGLVLVDQIDKILNALRQLRFSVRGIFGNGSTIRGALFQVSSLVSLGRDEEEIVNDFSYHVGKVLLHENSARDQLHARDRLWLEDLVQRSFALLRSARLITSQESFDRLSHVRLGVSLGILPEIPFERLNALVVGQQTAHLEDSAGESLPGQEKSAFRASFLRTELNRKY
jgi:protein arginine kinase